MDYKHLYKVAVPVANVGTPDVKPPTPEQAPVTPAPALKPNLNKMPTAKDTPEYRTAWWDAKKNQYRENALKEYQGVGDDVRKQYATPDAYANWKMEQDKHLWDRDAARRYVGGAYGQGRKDVEANTKRDWYTLGITKNVDQKWMDQFAGSRRPADPVAAARYDAYVKGVRGETAAVEDSTSNNANIGMHVATKALNGTTMGIGNVGDRYATAVTGQNADDFAREFGESVGPGAERWLRATGVGTELAASMPATLALWHVANGGAMTSAGNSFKLRNGANASYSVLGNLRHTTIAPNITALARTGQYGNVAVPTLQSLAAKAMQFGVKGAGTTAMVYAATKPVGTALTGAADVVDRGGRPETATESFSADALRSVGGIANDVAASAPAFGLYSGVSAFGAGPAAAMRGGIAAFELGGQAGNLVDNSARHVSDTYNTRRTAQELYTLDKDQIEQYADATGLPPEAAKAKWSNQMYASWDAQIAEKYPEAVNDPKVMENLRIQMAQTTAKNGGMLPDGVFNMPGMTQENRFKLFEDWATSRGLASVGVSNLVAGLTGGKSAIEQSTFKSMLKDDPDFRKVADEFMATSVQDYIQNPTGAELNPKNQAFFDTYCKTLGQAGVDQVMAKPFSTLKPDQWVKLVNQSSNMGGNQYMQTAASNYLVNKVERDPAAAGEFIPALFTQMQQGKGGYAQNPEIKQKLNQVFQKWTPEDFQKFADAGTDAFQDDDQLYTFAKAMMSGSGDVLEGLSDDKRQALEAAFTQSVQRRVTESILQNPANINKAASLWLRSKGMVGLADVAENPWIFYGGLALLLGGTAAIASNLFGEDDEEEDDDAAYRKRLRARYMNADGSPMTMADIVRS